MQVNPKIEYNEEDAGLSLEDRPAEQAFQQQESSESQDEADLSAVEQFPAEQDKNKNSKVKITQIVSSLNFLKNIKGDDPMVVGISMFAGVFTVVVIYAVVVFI